MRIPSRVYNSPDVASQVDRTNRTDKAQKEQPSSKSKRISQEDVKVNVSAKARKLAHEGSMDVAKVDKLREAVDNGSFAMDFKLIAERIVDRG